MKKAILLFTAATCLAGVANAQLQCFTDQKMEQRRKADPNVAALEAQFKAQIDAQMGKLDISKMKTTADPTWQDVEVLHVPIVFHIIHDYGNQEYVSDNDIYRYVDEINAMYAGTTDPNSIIPQFKGFIPGTTIKYASNTHIKFHLASKDPLGRPTHGITRYRNYISLAGGDNAKYDLWPRQNYMNVWIVRDFDDSHAGAGGYAYQPPGANSMPWWDGPILASGNINDGGSFAHEIGHALNLNHTWGSASGLNGAQPPCGDDDVDDTPPTHGHTVNHGCIPSNLYDTTCATGYAVTYPATVAADLFNIQTTQSTVTINYPDTTNAQNTMDYTGCDKMFTYLQGVRMRTALRTNIADRDNLPTMTNLVTTGVMDQNGQIIPRQDLPPIAEFSISNVSGLPNVFGCSNNISGPNATFTFVNRSWNDTISGIEWTFSNNALKPTESSTSATSTVSNRFGTPGWATVQMIAKSNAGSDTIIDDHAVYIADDNATPAEGYFQEFTQGGDIDKYPMFNYYKNSSKWEIVTGAGLYDNSCIRYKQFDARTTVPDVLVGTPRGDIDEFFTPAFDLSQTTATGDVYLTFFTAGAFRTSTTSAMNDVFEVYYSTDCGAHWFKLKQFKKNDISNNGVRINEFTPNWSEWKGQSLLLPASIKNLNRVFFRFTFKSGAEPNSLIGTGNNFYIDRLHISNWTTDVADLETKAAGITLAPNPTTGSTFVIIKDASSKTAMVSVTDITGKLVYSTEATLGSTMNRVEIPANAIAVKGMYMVSVTTGSDKRTEKLVVY